MCMLSTIRGMNIQNSGYNEIAGKLFWDDITCHSHFLLLYLLCSGIWGHDSRRGINYDGGGADIPKAHNSDEIRAGELEEQRQTIAACHPLTCTSSQTGKECQRCGQTLPADSMGAVPSPEHRAGTIFA